MKEAIKIITAALLFSISLQCQAMTLIEWSYAYVLVTKTRNAAVRAVTEGSGEEIKTASEEFLDIAAEVMWTWAEDPAIDVDAKKALWFLLNRSGKARYKKALVETAQSTGDREAKDIGRKIGKDKKLDLNAPGIYQRGTIS